MLKKKWEKPELVVLVRGKSEEAVLQACKGNNIATSQSSKYSKCGWNSPCSTSCSSVTTS